MKRRDFLKVVGPACGAGLVASRSSSAKTTEDPVEFDSVLVDIPKCTGCRKCEEACAEANGLPVPDIQDKSVFESQRRMTPSQFTVVNRHRTAERDYFVKRQCMHCNQPGCAAACLVKAMEKQREGPVTWDGSKCMGCRFCMISCPFDVPKFEYDKANPRISKCIMCLDRLEKGQVPACVEGCPVEALAYGKRSELLEVARGRIYRNHDQYISQIYGEHEVGGTGWLYLSAVPFEDLGFKTHLGTTPYPELSQGFLYSVPIVLLLWPPFLLAASRARVDGPEPATERGPATGGTTS